VPTRFDYDSDPGRYRLAMRLSRSYATASLYAAVSEVLLDAVVAVNTLDRLPDPRVALREARRVLTPGGLLLAAAISRDDAPELAAVWRPRPSPFAAEDAPALVASVFGAVEVRRWDAPLVTLPDPQALRDFLVARFVDPPTAADAARAARTPLTITKRGALVLARAGY